MGKTIISPTTAATTAIVNITKELKDAVFQVDSNIQTGVSVAIEQQDSDGSWNSIVIGGTALVLNEDTTQISFGQTNRIRFNKPITTSTTGIQMISDAHFGQTNQFWVAPKTISASASASLSASVSASVSASISPSPSA